MLTIGLLEVICVSYIYKSSNAFVYFSHNRNDSVSLKFAPCEFHLEIKPFVQHHILQLELSQFLHDSASNNINDIILDIFPQIINPWEVSRVIEWVKRESGKLKSMPVA